MDEARPRQKIRGKDEAEAETSRQGRGEAEADILRGKDEAAPNAASRCLEARHLPRGLHHCKILTKIQFRGLIKYARI